MNTKINKVMEKKEKIFRKDLKDRISLCKKNNTSIGYLDAVRIYSIKNNYLLVGPKELQLEIINYCNFDCMFCWFHSPLIKKRFVHKYMDYNLFKRIVNKAADIGTETIILSGDGEPFMHPRIDDMIDYITKKELGLKIYTNAALINKRRAELISKARESFIHINLPAATQETFKKIRSKALPRSFDAVKNSLMLLNNFRERIKTEIGFLITNYNFHEIPLIFRLTKEVGMKRIYFKFVKAESGVEKVLLSKEETNKVVRMLKENSNKKEYKNIYTNSEDIISISKDPVFNKHKRNMYYYSGNLKNKACYNGWFYTKICLSGHTSPCSINDLSLSGGDIRKKDFEDIYFSSKFKRTLLDGKNGLKFPREALFKCNFCFRPELNKEIHDLLKNE